jgi:sarcosine dehydrogenase
MPRHVQEAESPHTAALPGLLADAARLEAAIGPIDLVFGHNDLLPANLIDDGDRLWLIDWDYAGFNSPLFDLGGLAANNGLTEAQEARMLGAYFDRAPDAELWHRYRAMKCAAALRETLWSMVSEIQSEIDFDYRCLHRNQSGGLSRRPMPISCKTEDRSCARFPRPRKAVIIGGGIVGCSTAYHLARLGWTDTVLLERCKLTSGTTFHAAGLVGQLRTSANITQLLGYSVELYQRLEAETGLPTGWKRNGGLRLACNPARWTEVRRQATTAHSFGLEMHLLTPREAQEMWPLMQVDDVIGAAFLPTDGQANPSDITQSLARGARMAGAAIFEDTPVTRIVVEDGRIAAVETPQGRIECAVVIACAGQWTRDLAATIGVNVPLVPVEHQYMVTEAINGVTGTLPTLRDPDRLTYYKEEVGGLVMGGYEPNPIPWAVDGIPEGFHYTLLDSNYDQFEQFMERAIGRVPAFETAGIKQLINGPESFTPDGNFILGEAPEQPGFFVGAGFNAFGIAAGGGAGMALAEWVAKGAAPFDLWPVDIRRFGRPHLDTDWVRARTLEAYGKHYTIAWPSEEHESGRPCRRSPLYAQLRDAGACFGEKLGWERPNWFADRAAGEEPVDRYSFERPGWFDAVRREHLACRNAAVLIDQSSFAKFIVKGPDAAAALNWICAGNVDRPVGRLAYTQMLNERGGIECDLTVARLAADEFYIVTGTGFATHDFDWIATNLPNEARAQIVDVTSAHGVLSLMGPEARAILQRVSRDDVSNGGFPFGHARRIGIAGAPVLALRVTYVGELGWELHLIPTVIENDRSPPPAPFLPARPPILTLG